MNDLNTKRTLRTQILNQTQVRTQRFYYNRKNPGKSETLNKTDDETSFLLLLIYSIGIANQNTFLIYTMFSMNDEQKYLDYMYYLRSLFRE